MRLLIKDFKNSVSIKSPTSFIFITLHQREIMCIISFSKENLQQKPQMHWDVISLLPLHSFSMNVRGTHRIARVIARQSDWHGAEVLSWRKEWSGRTPLFFSYTRSFAWTFVVSTVCEECETKRSRRTNLKTLNDAAPFRDDWNTMGKCFFKLMAKVIYYIIL